MDPMLLNYGFLLVLFLRDHSASIEMTSLSFKWASTVAQMVKNLPAIWETWVRSLRQEDPWRREWLPTLASLPGEFHGQRSLAG